MATWEATPTRCALGGRSRLGPNCYGGVSPGRPAPLLRARRAVSTTALVAPTSSISPPSPSPSPSPLSLEPQALRLSAAHGPTEGAFIHTKTKRTLTHPPTYAGCATPSRASLAPSTGSTSSTAASSARIAWRRSARAAGTPTIPSASWPPACAVTWPRCRARCSPCSGRSSPSRGWPACLALRWPRTRCRPRTLDLLDLTHMCKRVLL